MLQNISKYYVLNEDYKYWLDEGFRMYRNLWNQNFQSYGCLNVLIVKQCNKIEVILELLMCKR